MKYSVLASPTPSHQANQPPTIKTPTPVPDRPSSRPKSGRLSSSLRHHEIDDKRTVARSPTFVSERTYTAFARGKRPSTSRTLTSVQSSNYKDGKISQNGVRTSFKMDKHITEALPAMEPAFLEVTKEIAGQYVWRLEGRSRVVDLEEQHHGFFHEGSVYIVLKVDSNETVHLHYWFGKHSTENDRKLIEEKAHELDRIVHHAHVFTRETQHHESICFLRNFNDGIIYIEGRPKTALSRATVYAKRMYIIDGRKFVRATCVEPSADLLDNNLACILDGFPRIYVWIGQNCPYTTRLKAIQVAKKIRNQQRKEVSHIVIIDEKDVSMNTAFIKKLHNGENLPPKEETINNFNAKIDVENIVLHRVAGERVMYDMPEASKRPLNQRYLVKRDSYLLDTGPESPLYVWVGSQANENAAMNGIKRGKSFNEHKAYPSHQAICRIMEDHEPITFRKIFNDWRDKDTKHRQLTKKYSIGNIERALFSTKDNRTVAKLDELWSEDLMSDIVPNNEIWRVGPNQLYGIPWNEHGIFNNGSCYIVLNHVKGNSKSLYVMYYWLGSKSSIELQEKTMKHVLSKDADLQYQCIKVRVLDGKEPTHFMNVLQNSIIIHDCDLKDSSQFSTQMFRVREIVNGNMRVLQVVPNRSSLNSSASFLIMSKEECFLWYGKKSGGPEREYTKSMLEFLNPSKMFDFEVVLEGRENNRLQELLGANCKYPLEFPKPILERRQPNLVLCHHTNSISFEDIVNFQKEDLTSEDIYFLDSFDQIFIWIGQNINEDVRQQLLHLPQKYIEEDTAGRCIADISLWIISQNHEPETFIKHFRDWSNTSYGGHDVYTLTRKRIRQENAIIDIDQEMVDRSYMKYPKYAYRELIKKEPTEEVNKSHKEFHLTERYFKEVMKMSRPEFYRLPLWKQEQCIKSARLGHYETSDNPLHIRCLSPE
ncbi:advillin-like isoform X2 [Mytilus galloprovincialis]|uniref:advillin-like isoform X2 n=1 Tax=Mytilus galloprovincialis TaxID=29158 RepID=UPI003F7B48A6